MENKRKLTHAFIKGIKIPEKRTEIYDTLVTGLILRVTKNGNKSFALRYWYDGQSKQITFGKFGDVSLEQARSEAKRYKKLISEGKDPMREKIKRKQDKSTTFKEAISQYKKIHLPTLKQSTRTVYEYRINHLIKGEGKGEVKARGFDGERYIKDLTRIEILDHLQTIAINSPVQAQRIQAILSGIFKFAKDREWVNTNIASNINLAGKRKKHNSKRQNLAFNNQQIKNLWSAFNDYEVTGYYLKILMILGQRAGETRLMKWNCIDYDKQLWTIPASDTKNSEIHYVPLSELALGILDKLKPWSGKSEFVFESTIKSGEPIGSAQKTAERIRNKYDIQDFNIHSLRTTFATRLAELGTPPQVLSKILNHKKPGEGSMITAIYNKYDYEDEKRIAINKWNQSLNQILTGKSSKIHEMKSVS